MSYRYISHKKFLYIILVRPIVQLVEHAAHNGLVVGSSPTRPILKIKHLIMDYNLKKYQILKLKKYFKNNNFFFILHSSKINSKEWIQIEQKIKKLKLKYYKIFNGTASKIIDNSIYANYTQVISSLIVFIKPTFKSTEIKLKILEKELKSLFILLSVKLNNKIYFISQVSSINSFSYKQNVFDLYKVLEKSLKVPYTLKKNFEIM